MVESDLQTGAEESSRRAFHAIVDADFMQRIVGLAHALVAECRIRLDEDGIKITAVDPATVAAVDLKLDHKAFETYEGAAGHVGVDLERLDEVLGMADADQLVEFRLDAETRTLHISIGELEYTLGLLDPETIRSPPDLSKLTSDSTGEVVLDSGEFDRAVKAADMVSDHVAFGIDAADETFYVEAEGDTDDVSLVQGADELAALTPEAAHSLFSIDYLQSIDRELPRGVEVALQVGTEEPLVVSFEFSEGAGSAEYFVSPRISSR